MPASRRNDGLSKFQRYRRARREGGMKLLRVWVADPASAEFRSEAARQAALLRGAPEEAEALGFVEAATFGAEP